MREDDGTQSPKPKPAAGESTIKPAVNKPHYHGHRQRLKERFLNTNGDGLADYELLELLLGMSIARRDVKPLAKELLRRFQGLSGVFNATPAQLQETNGIGESAAISLNVVRRAAIALLAEKSKEAPVMRNWENVISYCHAAMSHGKQEQLRLIFLNAKNKIIADEVQQTGTVNQTPIYPREVVKRALEIGASAVIMVHNHPSGDPTPSKADIELTEAVRKALALVDIQLHDHLVVGREGHSSLREMGLILQ